MISVIANASALHDIGKISIDEKILNKPGRLTPEEFEVMKTHTTLGYEAIHRAEESLGHEVPFLRFAEEIALSHQEKWDGSGYPLGLVGDAIPISARLMALAPEAAFVLDAAAMTAVFSPCRRWRYRYRLGRR